MSGGVVNDDCAVVLKVEGLSKSFPGVRALHDLSMELRRGEILALVGENGAGKSTFCNILVVCLKRTRVP